MPLSTWNTLDYSHIMIIVLFTFIGVFVVYAIFKLRTGYVKKFLAHFVLIGIIVALAEGILFFSSPKTVHMFYKYESNMQMITLINQGWEVVEHFGDKKIIHVTQQY